MGQEDKIDPKIQQAAEELREAYKKLQSDQDPLVKEADRKNVIGKLQAATNVTSAVEARDELESVTSPKPSKN